MARTTLVRGALTALAMLLAAAAPAATIDLLSPSRAATRASLRGISGVRPLDLDPRGLAALRREATATVTRFPLATGHTADLALERFEPFAPGARVEVMGPDGARPLALPDRVYFAGTVAGDPTSRVVLIAGPTSVEGFVATGGDVFPFGPDDAGRHRSYALRNADPTQYPPPADFCANDLHPEAITHPASPPVARLAPPVAAAGLVKQADVAIDTDQELRAKFASDGQALDYLSSLLAASTAIYERDVNVRLRFSYVRLWGASPADPWTAGDTATALGELRTYWLDPSHNMNTLAGSRDLVHFISGKSVQGGIAYLDVLCNQTYGFGVSQVYGSFDVAQPTQIWDVLVLTHEIGHNFGSPHSHCYPTPIDRCYNQEGGCYSGPVVNSRGTIMSYCHLIGGLQNVDLLFGSVVNARIGQSVAAASCLDDVDVGPTTTSTSVPGGSSTTVSTEPRPSLTTTTLPPTDGDGDGSPDAVDACPETPAGDLVDGSGCSLCPCDGPRDGGTWSSRAAYVRCIKGESRARLRRGTLGARDSQRGLRRARQSTCGRSDTTRCCLAGDRCRVVRTTACEGRPGAVDVGPGNCVPTPCKP